ncbi:hypothetical protein [Atopococcus tabaci]|uniref:hypothetical protein n=1 Tax=Atopococcus tabaci TaxID=269774 RepID=UPI0003FF66DB|nr:hypothetical protein [Atopococcus tabaci]
MIQAYEMLQLKLERLMEKRTTAAIRLEENEARRQIARARLEKETADVEKLASQSLSTFVRSLLGTYEKKLDKEKKDQVAAKIELDTAEALYLEAFEALSSLDAEIDAVQQELASLREKLKEADPAFREKVSQEQQNRIEWQQEVDELNEALRAGEHVLEGIDAALEELDSAGSLATWDMFTDSSFLLDMMKYNRIDQAEEEITFLERTLDKYRKELKDVDLHAALDYEELDHMRRTFDVFFDNIFSDWNTRDTIHRNISMLEEMGDDVEDIQERLLERKRELEENIRVSENRFQ